MKMEPPRVVVPQKRRTGRGRPSVDPTDASVYVSVTLSSKRYDDLCKRALEQGVSVPEIIRRDLEAKE
jgi:hypothetical protein